MLCLLVQPRSEDQTGRLIREHLRETQVFLGEAG
jgi:hypothetical protein